MGAAAAVHGNEKKSTNGWLVRFEVCFPATGRSYFKCRTWDLYVKTANSRKGAGWKEIKIKIIIK